MTLSSDQDAQQLPPDDDISSNSVQDELPSVEAAEQNENAHSEVDATTSVEIEDLTVAEMLGEIWRAPVNTLRAFHDVIFTPPHDVRTEIERSPNKRPTFGDSIKISLPQGPRLSESERKVRQREALLLGIRVFAFLVAVYGNWLMATERSEAVGLAGGIPLLSGAFIIWVLGEFFVNRRFGGSPRAESREEIEVVSPQTLNPFRRHYDLLAVMLRLMGVVLALAMSIITLSATSNNKFTTLGLVMWAASTILWVIVVAPREWSVGAFWASIREVRMPRGWTLAILVAIMIVAALFRFTDLNSIPSEMTSDHVEKILDSQRILDGNPQVFFPNNGGREPIQFYLMAIISQLPGFGMNHFTLKFLTAIEGMICIPVLWWMGREIIGEEEPELGNVVGLVLAALVAVSYWHTVLSRLGLRIVLTVIFAGLLMIYFSKALRRNRRGDFIISGLILGGGVYAYQATRMLPVVIIAGIVLAILFSLFRQGPREQIVKYVTNLAILILISLVVFVPMAGFARDYPEDFWRRTSGRLLGDEIVQTTDANGQIVTRNATLDERMAAFQQNLGILVNNIRNALLMYNWKGDVAWITAVPNRPEMDVVTGSLLIVGLGAWAVRMVKRRDVVDWLMPAALFIMLLPSALSIAYPIENPSATRTSGSLPEAYLFAALPLALAWFAVSRLVPNRWGKVIGSAAVTIIIFFAAGANWNTYFVDFNQSYTDSSPAPYTEAGRFLRGFADSGGGLGNAFMIAYPYWWDHRAVGIEAGVTDWPNGIVTLRDVPSFIKFTSQRGDKYQIDPDKDLLFFYNPADLTTETQLQIWFPTGIKQLIHSYKPGDDFDVFRVPKLGQQGLLDFETKAGA